MTIQQTIQKAIEGGYNAEWLKLFYPTSVRNIDYVVYPKIFLDPLFWQSLGKALGWNGKYAVAYKEQKLNPPDWTLEWEYQWHRFIDFLIAGGKSPESFFEKL